MSDPTICISENVAFERRVRFDGVTTYRMTCRDCGRIAGTDSSVAFDEAFFAKSWNAHHAHQLAAYVRGSAQ